MDVFLEVHAAHPKAGSDAECRRWASGTDQWARQRWTDRHQDSDQNSVPESFGAELIPAVVNTYGGWHLDFAWAQHQIEVYMDGENIPGLGKRQMCTVTARSASHLSVAVQ